MRVLGIDPGTVVTGYGVIDEENQRLIFVASGGIRTSSKLSISKRLKKIFDELTVALEDYEPLAVAIENTFVAKNMQTALKLGQARGVALLAAEHAGLPVFEYTPTQVKLAVTGYGAASKIQVQGMVHKLLKLSRIPDSHHAADALATAICHLHSAKIRELVEAGPPEISRLA
jgi:crossover junction endodeoxyribonuclease RuvC